MAKRGPNTVEGRAVVRFNAVRHAVLSVSPVIPGVECEDDWQAHHDGVMVSLNPDGQLETLLAERIALLFWRLQRVARYERDDIIIKQADAIKRRIGQHSSIEESKLAVEEAVAAAEIQEKCFECISLMSSNFEDQHINTLAVSNAVAQALLVSITTITGVNPGRIPRRSIPDYQIWGTYDRWSFGVLKNGIKAIAKVGEKDIEWLLTRAVSGLRDDLEVAKKTLKGAEKALRDAELAERLRREHLLPDTATMQNVVRYEAHLNRQLFQALHELEALQTRR